MLFRVLHPGLRVALIVAVLSGCGSDDPPPDEVIVAPVTMAELLSGIASDREDLPYFGDGHIRELRRQLAGLDQDAPVGRRVEILIDLGTEELRWGAIDESIAHLAEARKLSQPRVPRLHIRATFALAIAYLRLGETQNCCARNTPDSCIFPIQGTGVHTKRKGSSRAIELLSEVMESVPPEAAIHGTARWLTNIAHMTLGSYPEDVPESHLIPPASFSADLQFPRFRNIAQRLGLDRFGLAGGVVVDDFDGDGLLDILRSAWDPSAPLTLHRNNGNGTFSDVSQRAGLGRLTGGLNLIQADYDDDGDLDILVLRGAWLGHHGRHPNSLIRNNGDGTFTDVTFDAGLGREHYPTQTAAWADYDNDGDLDLYIGNESTRRMSAPSQLFRNNGDGTFTDVGAAAGVLNMRFAKGVAWGDFDGDRLPDLYVSNLRQPNRLYHNNGDGTFSDVAGSTGVAAPLDSFPAWFWDFDNDGVLDLFVSYYQSTGKPEGMGEVCKSYVSRTADLGSVARVYRGIGSGRFQDVSMQAGMNRVHFPMGANYGDIDNDGYLDIYLGTGAPSFAYLTPSVLLVSREGRRFEDVTYRSGLGHLQKGHGISFADIDCDGDLDVFAVMGGAYPADGFHDALFENPGFEGNNWLTVQAVGTQSNRCAIGARIRVVVPEGKNFRNIYRHVSSGGSFGANPLRQTIGLGRSPSIARLEVFWPRTGKTDVFHDVAPNRAIRITEGRATYQVLPLRPFRLTPKAPR